MSNEQVGCALALPYENAGDESFLVADRVGPQGGLYRTRSPFGSGRGCVARKAIAAALRRASRFLMASRICRSTVHAWVCFVIDVFCFSPSGATMWHLDARTDGAVGSRSGDTTFVHRTSAVIAAYRWKDERATREMARRVQPALPG